MLLLNNIHNYRKYQHSATLYIIMFNILTRYCLAEIFLLGSVPTTPPLRLRVRIHPILAVLKSLLFCPAFVVDPGAQHVMARKKSMPVFLRLLLKFTIRLEKWGPRCSSSDKLLRSPQASLGVFIPVLNS